MSLLSRSIGVMLVMMLFSACGDGDTNELTLSDDERTAVPQQAQTTPSGSPTNEPPATMTIPPATVTATAKSTPTPSPMPRVESTSTASEPVEYGFLTAWDAKWEKLGAMVLSPDGHLYIDDYVQDRLMVFALDGSEQPPLEYSSELPEFVEARHDLAIGPDGRIYLLEQSGGTWIQVFEPDGTLVNVWGGTIGFDETSLFDAAMIAVAPDGHIFTARQGALLQKFTSSGEFVAAWDRVGDSLFPDRVLDIDVVGTSLYVAAVGYRNDQNVILTFDFDGNLNAEPIVVGEADGEDRIVPVSLAVGPDGNLFIADVFRRQVIVLSPAGEELTRWSLDPTEQRFPNIEIAVDDAGLVYVADDSQEAVFVFAPDAGNTTDGLQQETSLAANPDRAPCGTPVEIIGKGFPPNSQVTLIEKPQAGTAAKELIVMVDAEGVFTTEFAPEGEAGCWSDTKISLEGFRTTIDALVDGDFVASVPFTVYPLDRLPGLRLSSYEVDCDDVLTLTGENFEPGSNVVVTVGVEGGHQPVLAGQSASVDSDGGFALELDVRLLGPCVDDSIAEQQEYIIWAITDRAKEGSSSFGYPSQRVTVTLLLGVE